MYRLIIRPILFLISPEKAHKLIVSLLKFFFIIPGVKLLINGLFVIPNKKLKTEFCNITFRNPVGLAAGFDKNASFYKQFSSFGFGFIEIGTITPRPQTGNPIPRLFRLPEDAAMINRMGFNNIGADEAVKNLRKRKNGIIIGGNIGKNSSTSNAYAADDYEICFRKLYDYVDYFVVNVSCPNITNMTELQDSMMLEGILLRLTKLRKNKNTYKPILVKISPDLNFSQIDNVIEIYHRTGIDGIVAVNTTIHRENLNSPDKLITKIGDGGLSGKPLRKRALEVIRYISEKSGGKIPMMGVGGILYPEDALEMIKAGAGLVQIYTGFIYTGPFVAKKINKAILKSR